MCEKEARRGGGSVGASNHAPQPTDRPAKTNPTNVPRRGAPAKTSTRATPPSGPRRCALRGPRCPAGAWKRACTRRAPGGSGSCPMEGGWLGGFKCVLPFYRRTQHRPKNPPQKTNQRQETQGKKHARTASLLSATDSLDRRAETTTLRGCCCWRSQNLLLFLMVLVLVYMGVQAS